MYFVVTVSWSQTDQETYIVKADTKEKALARLDKCNARYKTVIAIAKGILE